jgi:hypothetical protein
MERLTKKGHKVDLQILDNEVSAAFKKAITETWQSAYQLVPPNVHRRNAAERAIRTFKAHFLAILAGVDIAFPPYLWDKLLPQAELTLNLLRQATLDPTVSAWEYFQGAFDFAATPMGPMGCRILIHSKPDKRKSWDFRARDGYNIGPALEHYRCYRAIDAKTKAELVSDTVEFLHSYLTQPTVTPADRITHALQLLAATIKQALPIVTANQLKALEDLQGLFDTWRHQQAPPSDPISLAPEATEEPPPRVAPPLIQPPPPRALPRQARPMSMQCPCNQDQSLPRV